MKPTSATISFLQNGVQRDLDLMSSESGSILKFEAALEDHHTSIRLMPEKSIEVLELKVVFPYVFEKKDSILMNGYQSWTETREFSREENLNDLRRVPTVIENRYHFRAYGSQAFWPLDKSFSLGFDFSEYHEFQTGQYALWHIEGQ